MFVSGLFPLFSHVLFGGLLFPCLAAEAVCGIWWHLAFAVFKVIVGGLTQRAVIGWGWPLTGEPRGFSTRSPTCQDRELRAALGSLSSLVEGGAALLIAGAREASCVVTQKLLSQRGTTGAEMGAPGGWPPCSEDNVGVLGAHPTPSSFSRVCQRRL